jgi:FkbM family methyltransferase
VADLSESVVAENRRLRQELKAIRARLAAFESSRWWRLHPRRALSRLRPNGASADQAAEAHAEAVARMKVRRLARQWRLRAEHEQRNAGCEPDEIVVREGIRLKIHPKSRSTFDLFCYWSPEMVDELDTFIANTSDRQRLLDVGALHGLFSLVFAAHDRTKAALAVDPSPMAFATLLYNIHKNGAENIIASECALSNDSGTLQVHYSGEEAVAGDVGGDGRQLRVEKQTGDSLCKKYSFAPDVVKIDVEGHEVNVIQGLHETIARNKPLIFLELHPPMIRANEENGLQADLVSELVELGYRTAELRGRAVPLESVTELDEYVRLVLRPDAT